MFGQTPIMGIDLWEHAYYLKYKNLRKDYLENIFNVIDWNIVENYYNNLKQNKSKFNSIALNSIELNINNEIKKNGKYILLTIFFL